MKVAIAQINPTLGDLEGNTAKITHFCKKAIEKGADLIIFPEGSITGYPPQDLLYEKKFLKQNKEMLNKLLEQNFEAICIVSFVDFDEDWHLYNSAAVFYKNKLIKTVKKTLLPTYDVFDESRYFKPGTIDEIRPVEIEIDNNKIKLGIEICEDLWDEHYDIKVTQLLVERGAKIVVNVSASPYYVGKFYERLELIKSKVEQTHVPFIYVNLVGGQDELIFDGDSIALDKDGKLIACGSPFKEELILFDIKIPEMEGKKIPVREFNREKEIYDALILGLKDYIRKTGFKKAILGMSGGIDSSLVACIAVDALGKENVIGVSMPSKYSTSHSKEDAEILAENLGITFVKFPIQTIVEEYQKVLKEPLDEIRKKFGLTEADDDPVADENVQPRIRGTCLMDFSNRLKKLKIMVLNTGNKTELALGYCTLYGDLTGGLGVIGDVSKLDVYKLAKYVNEKYGREIIPKRVFTKKPSAELRPDQYDPFDFDIVSPMVDEIVEKRLSREELIQKGYPEKIVDDILKRIRRAEYKRWQAPPCLKITRKAFGIGWKMPIVNKYRE
ncbi:MAG: NAD+ synthase [Candidatus Heimdallarchaeaceae archaeon]